MARVVAPNTVAVTWRRIPGARTYVLVVTRSRNGPAARPAYPGGRVLGTFAHLPPELDSTPDSLIAAAVVEVKVMVVALDANGVEITRSRIVRIQLPAVVTVASS